MDALGFQPHTKLDQSLVLIVTGPPASGKTTIGRPLARTLGLPFLSKDLFKESLFDSLGGSDREWSRRIGQASTQLLFRCAEAVLEAGQSCALESNFYPQWDTAPLRDLQTRFGCRFVQVVCSAETAVLVDRFTRRAHSGDRHPGHADAFALDELIPRIVNEAGMHWIWTVLSFMWTPPGTWPTCISSYATSETSSTNTRRIS